MQSDHNTTEYGYEIPGMVRLRPGDVVQVFGRVAMVVKAGESNAQVAEAGVRSKSITDRVSGETATFNLPPQRHTISTTLPRENLLQRQGAAGLQYFLKNRTVQGIEQTKRTKATEENEGENSMAAKTKKVKKQSKQQAPESAVRKAASAGRLGGIKVGDATFSTCSVLRRLGMAGVGVPHAKAIIKAAGVKASDTTVSINIGLGAKGKGAMAQLTKEQVEELKSKAKDPQADKTA